MYLLALQRRLERFTDIFQAQLQQSARKRASDAKNAMRDEDEDGGMTKAPFFLCAWQTLPQTLRDIWPVLSPAGTVTQVKKKLALCVLCKLRAQPWTKSRLLAREPMCFQFKNSNTMKAFDTGRRVRTKCVPVAHCRNSILSFLRNSWAWASVFVEWIRFWPGHTCNSVIL